MSFAEVIFLARPYFFWVFLAFLFLWERCFPANQPASRSFWWTRALLFFGVRIFGVLWVRNLMNTHLTGIHPIFSLKDISILPGAMISIFVFTFFHYWWHRLRHRNNFVWRAFHQIHHSPARVELLTNYYSHITDFLANFALFNFVCVFLIELSIPQLICANILDGALNAFAHANVNTPRWLGYFIIRPAQHRLHHQQNLHYYNFGMIPIWDLLFGTFKNPLKHEAPCGFSLTQEFQLKEMLLFKEIGAQRKI